MQHDTKQNCKKKESISQKTRGHTQIYIITNKREQFKKTARRNAHKTKTK